MPHKDPELRYDPKEGAWCASVRFPDGSRPKVKKVDKTKAQADLDELLARRDSLGTRPERRHRQATFAEVFEAWYVAGCPSYNKEGKHIRTKSEKTIRATRSLVDNWLLPRIGPLWVDRTLTSKLESEFVKIDKAPKVVGQGRLASSTVRKLAEHLSSALIHGKRQQGLNKTNPAADIWLPEDRGQKARKSLTLEQAWKLITECIPTHKLGALWLTGLICGLRPGELLGLRWTNVDIDGAQRWLAIEERADETYDHKPAGQADPKGGDNAKRTLELHPLVVAALIAHRETQAALGHYTPDGLVFTGRFGQQLAQTNVRGSLKRLFEKAGFGADWTTYELRHSFVSLAANELHNLEALADAVGHMDSRTTLGYRHNVRPTLTASREAWNGLLEGRPPSVETPAKSA